MPWGQIVPSYSIEEGWEEGETDNPFFEWLIEYGFAQDIPGFALGRQFQDFKPKRLIGNTIFTLAAGTGWTMWASSQGYRSMTGIAYEALTGTRFSVAPVIPLVASVVVTEAFIGLHKQLQPDEPTHQPSWWNSIAAAMAGTFGGINTGDYS